MSSQVDKTSKKQKASKATRSSSKTTNSQKPKRSDTAISSGKSGKSTKSDRSKGSKKSGKSKKTPKKKKSYSRTLSRSTSKEIDFEEEKPNYLHLKLIFKGGVIREIKVENFVATSLPMKHRLSRGTLSKTLDLHDCTPECGNVIADYLEKGFIKSSISYYALGEVLDWSTIFAMDHLHKKMEDVMMVAAAQSAENLLQAILVTNCATVTKETMNSLHCLAAWRFLELAKLEDFYKIPTNQFLMIFGSCELNVSHELVAVDGALQWLAGQSNLETLAPTVFAMVRSTYLNKTERNLIIERTIALNFPEQVIRTIRILLDSRFNSRTCLKPEHINRRLVRCGLADSKDRKEESSLPLSKPKPEPVRQKKKEKSSKSKRKSERSGKKSRTIEKSEKSSKSGKSSREHSRKSSRSSESNRRSKSKEVKSSRRSNKSSSKRKEKPDEKTGQKSRKSEKGSNERDRKKDKKSSSRRQGKA